jgi:uncharacterized protein YjiS (DUF1127 family)
MSLQDARPHVALGRNTPGSQFARIVQNITRSFARRRREARARSKVAAMSDHLLKDIGLRPGEIWAIRQ